MDRHNLHELALYCAGFAIWGSVARTLADNLQAGKEGVRGRVLLGLLVINAVISCFAGMISLPISKAMNLGSFWTVACAGLAGYMGVGFIALIEVEIARKIGGNKGGPDSG